METAYTKEQLIAASIKYYQEVKDTPENFRSLDDFTAEENAKMHIDYLLSLIDA